MMELLEEVQRRVFDTVAPGKIIELFRIGEDGAAPGIPTAEVVAGFFSFLGFPRLRSTGVVRAAVARGVETGLFGYATAAPPLGDDGRYRLDRSRIAFERPVSADEIDLDSGFLILPRALPEPAAPGGAPTPAQTLQGIAATGGEVQQPTGAGDAPPIPGADPPPVPGAAGDVAISFTARSDKLYEAWQALANLADLAGQITISATAANPAAPLDPAKLEHNVLEPLRELGLLDDD